jgi:hypothetical protein
MTSCRDCGARIEGDPERCPGCKADLRKEDSAKAPIPHKPAWLGGSDLPTARPRPEVKTRAEGRPVKPTPSSSAPLSRPQESSRPSSTAGGSPVQVNAQTGSDPRKVSSSNQPTDSRPGLALPPTTSTRMGSTGELRLPPERAYASTEVEPSRRAGGFPFIKVLSVILVSALLAGGGYVAYDRFKPSAGSPTEGGASTAGGSIANFGTAVALDVGVAPSPGAEKLSGSLFPVGCAAAKGSATAVAYVVAMTGLPQGETGALTDSSALLACLESRVAYLHDGISALRVSISAYDAESGVALLQIPAPLPAQAVRLVEEVGGVQVGAIGNGGRNLVDPGSLSSPTPGAPLLDPDGYFLGLLGAQGERIPTGTLCGTLLIC